MDRARQTEEIIRLFREISHSMGHNTPETWMDLNLTLGQLKSLFFIAFQGSTNLNKVATALGVTPPNVTGIVDRLVEQGLVSREENPENRRMLVLTVTEKGKNLLVKLRENNMNRMLNVLSKLGEDELSMVVQGFAILARAAKTQQGKKD